MRLFGIFTFNLFIGVAFVALGMACNDSFFLFFIKNQILSISATFIAFNYAGIIFLISSLLRIDCDLSKIMKEVKHNAYIMGIMFISMMTFIFILPALNEMKTWTFILCSLIMFCFSVQLYAAREILGGMFILYKKIRSQNSQHKE